MILWKLDDIQDLYTSTRMEVESLLEELGRKIIRWKFVRESCIPHMKNFGYVRSSKFVVGFKVWLAMTVIANTSPLSIEEVMSRELINIIRPKLGNYGRS